MRQYDYRTLQVNVGCVPKKVMYNCSLHAEFIRDHADYGFDVTLNKFDFKSVIPGGREEINTRKQLYSD